MDPLVTERLVIRNFNIHDQVALHGMIIQYQASDMAAYDQQWPTSEAEIKGITEWFAREDGFLAVCLKDTGRFIGFVALNPEQVEDGREFNIGYVFDADYHGHGYATEACAAVLERAFRTLEAARVVTGTAAVNLPSCRLLERLGFSKIGEQMTSFRVAGDGKPVEFLGLRYAMSNNEWESRQASRM